MGNNYYLDAPGNDAGHLGKWAIPYFTARAPDGVNSFADWVAQMNGRTIYSESGYEVTAAEVIEMATAKDAHGHAAHHNLRSPQYSRGEFVDNGVLFVRNRFH